MSERSFLDLELWIRRFEADPLELLEVRDEWMMHVCDDVPQYTDDPSPTTRPDPKFLSLSRVLQAWADYRRIDGAGAIGELSRQMVAYWEPGIPWGNRQPREAVAATASQALAVVGRITDQAFIQCKARENDLRDAPGRGTVAYEVLQVLFEKNAFDLTERLTTEDIAVRLAGRGTDPNSFKRPVTELANGRLIHTKTGRRGGCWLTSKGRLIATKIFAEM